jgi:hypothetical protein
MRPLKCVLGRHDWRSEIEHDPVTDRVTRECARCGARRRYAFDPRAPSEKYRYPGADDSGIGHGGG